MSKIRIIFKRIGGKIMKFFRIFEELIDGTKRAYRSSWNPDNYIYIEKGKRISNEVLRSPQKTWFKGYDMIINHHFNLVENYHVTVGWMPTQEDLLANDWEIL